MDVTALKKDTCISSDKVLHFILMRLNHCVTSSPLNNSDSSTWHSTDVFNQESLMVIFQRAGCQSCISDNHHFVSHRARVLLILAHHNLYTQVYVNVGLYQELVGHSSICTSFSIDTHESTDLCCFLRVDGYWNS